MNLEVKGFTFIKQKEHSNKEVSQKGIERLETLLSNNEQVFLSTEPSDNTNPIMNFTTTYVPDIVGTIISKNEDGTYACRMTSELPNPEPGYVLGIKLYVVCTDTGTNIIARVAVFEEDIDNGSI